MEFTQLLDQLREKRVFGLITEREFADAMGTLLHDVAALRDTREASSPREAAPRPDASRANDAG